MECVQCIVSLFFFFQAEDGIRDIGVTGVRTCALPISYCKADPIAPTRTLFLSSLKNVEIPISASERPETAFHRRPAAPGQGQIGRASCRGKSVDLGGRRIIKKKKKHTIYHCLSLLNNI